MDQATSSSWKLLPWPILGGSNKKPRVDRSPKKVSALRRRLQGHVAIARSLSPFCARTSFPPAMPEEENKCLLSLSAFVNACSRCTFRDVHVPLASVRSPHQQKAYIKAIHHHLQEPSLQRHTKAPASRRAHHKASFGGAFHTEELCTSREGHSMPQRDHHHRHTTPPKKGELKRIEAYECNENEFKPNKQDKHHQLKQYRQVEVIKRGESRPKKHGKSHHKLEEYVFDSGDNNQTEHSHHCIPSTSSSTKKGIRKPKDSYFISCDNTPIEHASHGSKASTASSMRNVSQLEAHHKKDLSVTRKTTQALHNLDADLYVCTTTHVLEKHKGKMKTSEEGMHNYGGRHPSLKSMHRYKNEDPPILKPAHHKHAGTGSPGKNKHNFITKSLESYRHASEDPQSSKESNSYRGDALSVKEQAHQHTSKNPSLSYLSLKECHESNECYTSKDTLSLNCSESYANKDPLVSFKGGQSNANKDLFSLKGSESHVYKDSLLLKSSESYVNKDLSFKVTPSPASKDIQSDINDAASARHDHEKIKLMRLDHDKVSGGIWMQDTLPVLKYSHNPYRDFHNSMLEMLLVRGLKDLHELQDMFVCYVLLNSPRNQKHIEKAFRDLLTDLYKCKLMKSLQVDEMLQAKA